MKRLLILILALLSTQTSLAADLLDEINARMERTEITEGRFRQEKQIRVLKKPLISTGVFTYHQKKGVIWRTVTPAPSVVLVNESRLLTQRGEQALPAAFGKVFTAMLGGDLKLLTERFDIFGTNSKEVWRLRLKPKEAVLQKMIVGVELTGDKELKQLEINEANGNFTRITFERMTHPSSLTAIQEVDFERLSSPP